MDILYCLGGNKKTWFFNELKYSLRSIEKFATGFNRVFLIGYKPKFLNYFKIRHIDFLEKHTSFVNVFNKLLFISRFTDISEYFIYFNDDFYLLKSIELNKIPYWYKDRDINFYSAKHDYSIIDNNTKNFLKLHNKNTLHFAVHKPIILNKSKIIELAPIMFEYIVNNSPLGLSIRDLYCNWYDVSNISKTVDYKISKISNELSLLEKDMFSSCNFVDESIKSYLANNFPQKSQWEV